MFNYPTWLKRILLPYEFEDHPLYFNPDSDDDEIYDKISDIFGDEFADRMKNF